LINNPKSQDRLSVEIEYGAISAKSLIIYAVIGLFIGIISYFPIFWLFFNISLSVGEKFNLNRNTDDFMAAFICIIPALIISLVGGIVGGVTGNRKINRYFGAILGGLSGSVIILLLMSILILRSWAGS